MPAQYFVQIGDAQIYFDVNRDRCSPPRGPTSDGNGVIYFVRFKGNIALIQAEWDMALASFDSEQRGRARLWNRSK